MLAKEKGSIPEAQDWFWGLPGREVCALFGRDVAIEVRGPSRGSLDRREGCLASVGPRSYLNRPNLDL